MNPLLRIQRGRGGSAPQTSLRWSNPATWGGTLPAAGDAVVISAPIIWDVASTPALASLQITASGSLRADPTMNVGLTAGSASVDPGGAWQITGAALTDPYAFTATIDINGARSVHTPRAAVNGTNQGYTNDGLSRAINNRGTRLWRGTPRTVHITKLNATALSGVTSITVKDNVTDWKTGDRIVIAPTNFYGQSNSEAVTLTADGVAAGGGNYTLTFTPALTEKHFGLLQYPIDAAYGVESMSLTPGTFTAHPSVPTVLDCRAEVLNLSAGNIVVRAPNDSAWSTQGWGVHMMDHPGSTFQDTSVRVLRGGQRGANGRYPFHAHMMSYADITAPVTFTISSDPTVVNWPNHGITPTTPQSAAVTFAIGAFGGLHGSWPGGASILGLDQPIAFTGASLPSGIVAGREYYVLLAGGDAPGDFFVTTAKTGGAINSSLVLFGTAGSGTIANVTEYQQPIQFSTTGTLPTGIVAGTTYYTVGWSITTNSFSICTVDDAAFIPTRNAPIIATGTASGVHTAKLTRFTVDRTDCYRKFCVVDTSENRGYTTHATCGTDLFDSICFDTKGMTFFLENGSEERNRYRRLFALKVRNPALVDALKLFDIGDASGAGSVFARSSAHWNTNLQNEFTACTAADCEGFAVWNSLALRCFGESALVAIIPNTRDILLWQGNGGHSNAKRALFTGAGVADETGTINGPPAAGRYGPYNVNTMSGGIGWKNNQGGYSNTAHNTHYLAMIMADNYGGDFEGSMEGDSEMRYALSVGQSLNDGQLAPIVSDYDGTLTAPRFSVASYHYSWIIYDCVFQNYPWVKGLYKRGGQQDYGGGAFNTRDLYTLPIASQHKYLTGLKFNNSNPGYLSRAPRYAGYPLTLTLANPCIVNVAPGGDMQVQNNEPFIFPRSTGVLPAAFALDTVYYVSNARTAVGGTLLAAGATCSSCELSLTPGGASISTAAQSQSGVHDGMAMWRATGENLNFNVSSVLPDPYCYYGAGTTGTTPRFVTHNRPYFTNSAANVINADPQGLAISTTTGYVGFGNFGNELHNGANPDMGILSERINPSTEAVIDNFQVGPAVVNGVGGFFPGYEHVCLQDGGRYRITHPAYPLSTTTYACRIVAGQRAASMILLELPWPGTAAIGSVARAAVFGFPPLAGLPTVTASSGDGSQILCTAATGASRAAKIAAVAASATGSLYFQDTAANSVFVLHTPVTHNAAGYASLPPQTAEKADESTYIILRA